MQNYIFYIHNPQKYPSNDTWIPWPCEIPWPKGPLGAPELLRQLIGRQLQTSQKGQGFHQRNADLAVLLAGTVTPLTLRCHGLTVTGTVNAD